MAQQRMSLRKHGLAAFLLTTALAAAPMSGAGAVEISVGGPGFDDHNTSLHLVERANRLVPRDLAHVELRLEIGGSDPKALETELNQRMAAALDQAKKVPGLEIETGAFAILRQVPPAYPRGMQSVPVQPGGGGNAAILASSGEWKASQILSLSGRDLRALAGLLTELQKEGAVVSDMRYEVAPETLAGVRKELTGTALANLRAEAEQMASAMGMRVDRYRSIDLVPPPLEMAQQQHPAFARPGMNGQELILQASDADVTVTVNANIALAPKTTP